MHCVKQLLLGKENAKEFITRGLDSDQTVSAIKATEKMLNIIYKFAIFQTVGNLLSLI